MDWTKIKTKHFLYTDLSLVERGALATLLCLTAHLERIPTEKEIAKHLPQATRTGLAQAVQRSGTTLAEVLHKVCEDSERVSAKRCAEKEKKRKQRGYEKCPEGLSAPREDKRREEKIREEKKEVVVVEKSTTPQATFMEAFSFTYETATGYKFKTDKKHYAMIAKIIAEKGYDCVVEKTKILAHYCQCASVWFTKEGWSCFTPENLIARWNNLIPIMTEEQKKDAKFKEAFKKEQEDRRRADELVKDSITA